MKRYLSVLAISVMAVAAVLTAGCAAGGAPPSGDQVAQIQTACAVDAGVRPIVTGLLAIPGLAQPSEIAVVVAARAVIDPICANPAGSLQANATEALASASGQLVALAVQLQSRRAAPP